MKVTQLCPTLCDPMDSLWPHGILQARILKWVAFSSPGDIPNPGVQSRSPRLQADSLPAEPRGKPKITGVGSLSLLQRIFPTQESNQSFLRCRKILYQLSYGVHITFIWTEKSIHLYDSLYFDSHIIAVIWNWIYNISEVCLYKHTHTHTHTDQKCWLKLALSQGKKGWGANTIGGRQNLKLLLQIKKIMMVAWANAQRKRMEGNHYLVDRNSLSRSKRQRELTDSTILDFTLLISKTKGFDYL